MGCTLMGYPPSLVPAVDCSISPCSMYVDGAARQRVTLSPWTDLITQTQERCRVAGSHPFSWER